MSTTSTTERKSPYDTHGVECKPGWAKLYQPLIDLCTLYGYRVHQVKEKFGVMRFYYSTKPDTFTIWNPTSKIHAIAAAAEEASTRTCEDCGEDRVDYTTAGFTGTRNTPRATTGASKNSGWIRTLCEPCRAKWDASLNTNVTPASGDAQ